MLTKDSPNPVQLHKKDLPHILSISAGATLELTKCFVFLLDPRQLLNSISMYTICFPLYLRHKDVASGDVKVRDIIGRRTH